MWPAYPFSDTILAIVCIYITNLGYLEDELSRFTKLPGGNIEESNKILVELNTAVVILETNA